VAESVDAVVNGTEYGILIGMDQASNQPNGMAGQQNGTATDNVLPKAPVSQTTSKLKEQASTAIDGGQSLGERKIGGIDEARADQVAKNEGDEYWESYAREIELEKAIAEIGGVQKVENGEVALPKEVAKEMGISPTINIQTPMTNVTGFSVSGTTLSDDQLAAGLSKPTSTGFRWLAEWFVYQLLKAHFHLKKVGGRILRSKD
jgi:hypothetical protein